MAIKTEKKTDVAAPKPKALKPAQIAAAGGLSAAPWAGLQLAPDYEDLVQFNRDNVEAFVRSSQVWARGVQEVGKAVLGLAQESLEDGVAAGRAAAGAKTLKELIDIQAGLAQASLDKMVAGGSHLSEVSNRLAQDSFAPLNERLALAVDRFVKPV